jgi:hypothetical protein
LYTDEAFKNTKQVISYRIEDNGIMWVTFTGNINYHEILSWLEEFRAIPDLPLKMNFIYDLRNATLLIDMVKLIQITKKTDEATRKFERVRTAFVIEEADLETFSILFSFLDTKERKTTRKVYTNLDNGIGWLLNEDVD